MDKVRKAPIIRHDMFCNVCGKKIAVEKGIMKEDVFEAAKEWGYFPKYDLELHKFNMCEDCYDKFISSFKIPIQKIHKKEAL